MYRSGSAEIVVIVDHLRMLEQLSGSLPASRFAGVKTILAVSGGADSVAMLHLVHSLWTHRSSLPSAYSTSVDHLVVAHFNHRLRGEASDGDQDFVVQLAQSLGIPCVVNEAQDSAMLAANASTDEASLRSTRYRFLQQTAEQLGARYVLVAHTADDNVETILHHLFRGSGPAGLAGIAPHRELGHDVMIVRPMLPFRRDELRGMLQDNGYSWREDSSNQDERYQRNWLRATLLPLLRQRYPQVDGALLRTIDSQRVIHDRLEAEALAWIDREVEFSAGAVVCLRGVIDLATLSAACRIIWDRMRWPRRDMTNKHLRQIHAVLSQPCKDTPVLPTSFTLPSAIQCDVNRSHVVFQQQAPSQK